MTGVPTILDSTIEKWVTPTASAARQVLEVEDYFTPDTLETLTLTWYAFKGEPVRFITTLSVVTRGKE